MSIKARNCRTGQIAPIHGLSRHPLYRTWESIIQRCTNPNNDQWEYYGGRGIGVWHLWKDNGALFVRMCRAMGWKKGLTIDRINNNGNYEPRNIRFVPMVVNAHNRRVRISNNTSGYRGVSCCRESGRYEARLMYEGDRHYLGRYSTARAAALARDNFIIENGWQDIIPLQIKGATT